MTDRDDDKLADVLEDAEREVRRIEREFDATLADAHLEASGRLRLGLIGVFAVVTVVAYVAGGSQAEFADTINWLAIFAACSAGFHIATWALLRAWYRRRHGRGRR